MNVREANHMADKLILDPQAIVDKEFDIDFKGYNPEQVDLLLDSVIKDYQTYQKMIRVRNQKIEDLEKTNASLRAKLIEVEGRMKAQEDARDPYAGASNVDILKRLSRLEKQVFDTKNRK
jgi:DivIVA domain-containing protein